MKTHLTIFFLLFLLSCSSSKFSLPDKYPLTQISAEKTIELYKYRSDLGNTCLISIMELKDSPNSTFVSGILTYDFLNLLSTIDKKKLEKELDEMFKNYNVAIVDNNIMFIDEIKEKKRSIPKGILMQKVKEIGDFTCAYSALLEEFLKKLGTNEGDE
jgi:hypothetical protein